MVLWWKWILRRARKYVFVLTEHFTFAKVFPLLWLLVFLSFCPCLRTVLKYSEVALHRCSYKKVFWKFRINAANLLKLLCNFIEITLRHGCFSVNLQHIFRTPLPRNTNRELFLNILFTIKMPASNSIHALIIPSRFLENLRTSFLRECLLATFEALLFFLHLLLLLNSRKIHEELSDGVHFTRVSIIWACKWKADRCKRLPGTSVNKFLGKNPISRALYHLQKLLATNYFHYRSENTVLRMRR